MLIQTIKGEHLEARKSRDMLKATLLTTLLGDIIRVGKDKGNRETSDEEALHIVKKYLKILEDNLALDLPSEKIFQLSTERSILLSYLPKQATRTELLEFLSKHVGKPKGELFKLLKQEFGGNFDSRLAASLLT